MKTLKALPSVLLCLSLFGSLAALRNPSANAAPARTDQAATSTVDYRDRLSEVCKKNANAVVTIYAGTEIGTGSIVSEDGLVITNYHVVQEAVQSKGKTKIYVKRQDGTRYLGRVVGELDRPNDLAVVKLDTQTTFTDRIALADTSSIFLSQPVCAIGNPSGLTSVSAGIFEKMLSSNDLRSKIPLIPGNSGGPLLNEQGKMIGVNKAILLSATGESQDISFSTRSDVAQGLINGVQPSIVPVKAGPTDSRLPASDSSLQLANRPVASGGVMGAIMNPKSLIIQQIVLGSPADGRGEEGLRLGARIIKIDSKPIKNLADLQKVLNHRRGSIKVTSIRDGVTFNTVLNINLK